MVLEKKICNIRTYIPQHKISWNQHQHVMPDNKSLHHFLRSLPQLPAIAIRKINITKRNFNSIISAENSFGIHYLLVLIGYVDNTESLWSNNKFQYWLFSIEGRWKFQNYKNWNEFCSATFFHIPRVETANTDLLHIQRLMTYK